MPDQKAALQKDSGKITKQNQFEQKVFKKAYIFDL